MEYITEDTIQRYMHSTDFYSTLALTDDVYDKSINIYNTIIEFLSNNGSIRNILNSVLDTLSQDSKESVSDRTVSLALLLHIVYNLTLDTKPELNLETINQIICAATNNQPYNTNHQILINLMLNLIHTYLKQDYTNRDHKTLLKILFTCTIISYDNSVQLIELYIQNLKIHDTEIIFTALYEWLYRKKALEVQRLTFYNEFLHFLCLQLPTEELHAFIINKLFPQIQYILQSSLIPFYFIEAFSQLPITTFDHYKKCENIVYEVNRLGSRMTNFHGAIPLILSILSNSIQNMLLYTNHLVKESNYFIDMKNIIFDSLAPQNMFSGKLKLSDDCDLYLKLRTSIMDVIHTLFSDKSVYKSILEMSNEALVNEGISSIQKIVNYSTASTYIIPCFITFLNTHLLLKNKHLWKVTFQLWTIIINKLTEISIDYFNICRNNSYFVKVLLQLYKNDAQNYAGIKFQNEESVYTQLIKIPFHEFYTIISRYWFSTIFKTGITAIAKILKENETFTLQTEANNQDDTEIQYRQLRLQEIQIYKRQLKQCISGIFHIFDMTTLIEIPYFNLNPILSTSLRSPDFTIASNAWLLPILSSYLKRDHLRFFMDTLNKIAIQLHNKASKLAASDIELVEVKQYKLLEEQIWSLLPNFFRESLDAYAIFTSKEDTKNLCTMMMNNLDSPNIRNHICSALIILINQIKSVRSTDKSEFYFLKYLWNNEDPCSSKFFIKSQLNQFMGLLVVRFLQFQKSLTQENLSIVQSENSRISQLFFNTLRNLVDICDTDILEKNLRNFTSALKTTIDKSIDIILSKNDSSIDARITLQSSECESLIDVIDILINQISTNEVLLCIQLFLDILQKCCHANSKKTKNQAIAKPTQLTLATPTQIAERILIKAVPRFYKLLKHLFERFMIDCNDIIVTDDQIKSMWDQIYNIRVISRSIALKTRTSFLRIFVKFLHKHNFAEKPFISDILSSLIPETLLNLMSLNKSVQVESQDLFKAIAENICSENDLFTFLIPGLQAKTTTMRCVTYKALTLLVSYYGDKLDKSLMKDIFNLAVLCLKQPEKQIYASGLLYIRKYQKYIPKEELIDIVKTYIEPLLNSPHHNTYRLPIRNLLEKVVKKLSVETLQSIFPVNHKQFLTYMDKQIRRKKVKLTKSHQRDTSDQEENERLFALKNTQNQFSIDFSSDEEEEEEQEDNNNQTKQNQSRNKRPNTETFLLETDEFNILDPQENNFLLRKNPTKKKRTTENLEITYKDLINKKEANPFVCKTNIKSLTDLAKLKPQITDRLSKKKKKIHRQNTKVNSKPKSQKRKKSTNVLPYTYIKLKPHMMKEKNRSHNIKSLKETLRRKK